jgi:hypothetical protein
MRLHLTVVFSLAVAATVAAQVGDLEFCSVVGTVVDEQGSPVPGIRVEIRRAEDSGAATSGEFGREDDRPNEYARDFSRDANIFGWGVTDQEGRYKISGVRKPGAFMLIIRSDRRFHRVEAPVSIDMAIGDEFVADLVLRPVGNHSQDKRSELLDVVTAAQAAEKAGDLERAMMQIEKAGALAPGSAIPHFHLARLALAVGDEGRAIEEARAATSKEPDCGDCWLLQARIERSLGHPDKARGCAEKALVAAPDLSSAHGIMGVLLYEAKEYEAAVPSLEEAVAADDPDPNVHLYLANSYMVLRRAGAAADGYRSYLERFPNAPNREQVERVLATLGEPPG